MVRHDLRSIAINPMASYDLRTIAKKPKYQALCRIGIFAKVICEDGNVLLTVSVIDSHWTWVSGSFNNLEAALDDLYNRVTDSLWMLCWWLENGL